MFSSDNVVATTRSKKVYLYFPFFDATEDEKMDPEKLRELRSKLTLAEGPANVRLSEAVQRRIDRTGEYEHDALHNLIQSDEGQRLWEAARDERMEEEERRGF